MFCVLQNRLHLQVETIRILIQVGFLPCQYVCLLLEPIACDSNPIKLRGWILLGLWCEFFLLSFIISLLSMSEPPVTPVSRKPTPHDCIINTNIFFTNVHPALYYASGTPAMVCGSQIDGTSAAEDSFGDHDIQYPGAIRSEPEIFHEGSMCSLWLREIIGSSWIPKKTPAPRPT